MNLSVGTFLFVAAVVGNLTLIVAGLLFGFVVVVRRGFLASRERWLLAGEHEKAFHHHDRLPTPFGEWLFMAGACAAVVVGLPVLLAALFQLLLPLLGRLWTH